MEKVIDIILSLFLFGIFIVIAVSFSIADTSGQAARRYQKDVISEIENSNFSDAVISTCINQAADNGYSMNVNKITINSQTNEQIAEVALTYAYDIPILNVHEEKIVKGVAR